MTRSLHTNSGAQPVAWRRISDDGVVTFWEKDVPGSVPLYAAPASGGARAAVIEALDANQKLLQTIYRLNTHGSINEHDWEEGGVGDLIAKRIKENRALSQAPATDAAPAQEAKARLLFEANLKFNGENDESITSWGELSDAIANQEYKATNPEWHKELEAARDYWLTLAGSVA